MCKLNKKGNNWDCRKVLKLSEHWLKADFTVFSTTFLEFNSSDIEYCKPVLHFQVQKASSWCMIATKVGLPFDFSYPYLPNSR